MQRISVITGDIVESGKIRDKKMLMELLHELLGLLSQRFDARWDIYRGDEFQVLIPNPADSVLAAVLIRAAIISRSPSRQEPWDARLSIGVGTTDNLTERVAESSGEAFILSGRGLDEIGHTGDRLRILTPVPEINRQLSLLTRMADDILSHWSHYAAQVAYYSLLYDESQQALAQRLERSQPTINSRLATARMGLIREYIGYTGEILSKEW